MAHACHCQIKEHPKKSQSKHEIATMTSRNQLQLMPIEQFFQLLDKSRPFSITPSGAKMYTLKSWTSILQREWFTYAIELEHVPIALLQSLKLPSMLTKAISNFFADLHLREANVSIESAVDDDEEVFFFCFSSTPLSPQSPFLCS
jgi:hypothetical protein